MSDFDTLVISAASLDDFTEACSKVAQALPKEAMIRLNRILLFCVQRYGLEGAYERINHRSVSQILAEYPAVDLKDILPEEDLKLIASGEMDGMRYELFDAPSPDTTKDECSDERS